MSAGSTLMAGVDLSGSVWDSMPSMSKDVVLVVDDSWCGESFGVVLDCSSSLMGKRSRSSVFGGLCVKMLGDSCELLLDVFLLSNLLGKEDLTF